MFTVKHITESGFDKVILEDQHTKTKAEVIPACGAILYAFSVQQHGQSLNVIDSYDSPEDFEKNVTAKGFKGSKLSPFVCRLKDATYKFGQEEYHVKKFHLGKSAIHGLIYDAVFEIVEEEASEEKASLILKHSYIGEDEGYPFEFDCIINYTLVKDNRLSIKTTILNKSNGLIPVQDGWHPYFTLGKSIDELQLEFQSKEMVEFDEELIPTGKLIAYQDFGSLKKLEDHFFDNCFTVNFAECQPMCVLRDSDQNIQLEIYPEKSYPYLQIYTPPHRNSIAIENLSGAPDAFNNAMGLISLAKDESMEFKTAYKITALS